MDNQAMATEDFSLVEPTVEEIAAEVALIPTRRLSAKDIVRLFQVVFLEVEEAFELLRVKPKTISTWTAGARYLCAMLGAGQSFY